MGLTNNMVLLMTYINGSNLYISDLEPFSFSTGEIETNCINAIFSIMEEYTKPQFLMDAIEAKYYTTVYHHYYCVSKYKYIDRLFDEITRLMTKYLNKGSSILLHCRDGKTYTPLLLTVFFLYSLAYNPNYIICDYSYFIPCDKLRWSDSFMEFIEKNYKSFTLKREFLDILYIYENNLLYSLKKIKYMD